MEETVKTVKIVIELFPTPNGCKDCAFGAADSCGLENEEIQHNLKCCGVSCGGNTALRFIGVEGVPEEGEGT
jgi:hypothetical protein